MEGDYFLNELGLFAGSEFFVSELFLGFPDGFVCCEVVFDSGDAFEEFGVVVFVLPESGFDSVELGVVVVKGPEEVGVDLFDTSQAL